MDGGEEGRAVFCVTGSDTAPCFEHEKRIFNQVAQLVEVFVVWSVLFPVFLRRDNRGDALSSRLPEDGIGIVAFIRNQMVGIDPCDQF